MLLDYNEDNLQAQYFSHEVETKSDGMRYKARLMVKIRETETLIDPLDFRYHNGKVLRLRQLVVVFLLGMRKLISTLQIKQNVTKPYMADRIRIGHLLHLIVLFTTVKSKTFSSV